MANIITCIRIVLSAALLFSPALSPVFWALYLAAGFSDMIDGAAARKTGTVSELGSRLDTIADIVFTAVCLIRLLPVLEVPAWLYTWIAVIAVIKADRNRMFRYTMHFDRGNATYQILSSEVLAYDTKTVLSKSGADGVLRPYAVSSPMRRIVDFIYDELPHGALPAPPPPPAPAPADDGGDSGEGDGN